jgi:hypothetical protein
MISPSWTSPARLRSRAGPARLISSANPLKAFASSGGQEQRIFGPIGPPYGAIISSWHPCGMPSKNLKIYRTFDL